MRLPPFFVALASNIDANQSDQYNTDNMEAPKELEKTLLCLQAVCEQRECDASMAAVIIALLRSSSEFVKALRRTGCDISMLGEDCEQKLQSGKWPERLAIVLHYREIEFEVAWFRALLDENTLPFQSGEKEIRRELLAAFIEFMKARISDIQIQKLLKDWESSPQTCLDVIRKYENRAEYKHL